LNRHCGQGKGKKSSKNNVTVAWQYNVTVAWSNTTIEHNNNLNCFNGQRSSNLSHVVAAGTHLPAGSACWDNLNCLSLFAHPPLLG